MMLCQIVKGEAFMCTYMYKKWSKSFWTCWVWQRRKFVGLCIWWVWRARKFKICRNHWMDKRSCHLARCHESEYYGLFNPNKTARNHNRFFAG